MARRIQKFRRLWRKSPRLAFAFLRRKMTRQAKRIITVDEWNINWLGEEMRPFNSLRNWITHKSLVPSLSVRSPSVRSAKSFTPRWCRLHSSQWRTSHFSKPPCWFRVKALSLQFIANIDTTHEIHSSAFFPFIFRRLPEKRIQARHCACNTARRQSKCFFGRRL